MASLFVEKRAVGKTVSLSWDLARHLYLRHHLGPTVIVADNPAAMLSTVCKQWQKVTWYVQRERSSTLDNERISKLSLEVAQMQRLAFVALPPHQANQGDVFFATLDRLIGKPPACYTLYATCDLPEATLHALTQNMSRHGLVVLY